MVEGKAPHHLQGYRLFCQDPLHGMPVRFPTGVRVADVRDLDNVESRVPGLQIKAHSANSRGRTRRFAVWKRRGSLCLLPRSGKSSCRRCVRDTGLFRSLGYGAAEQDQRADRSYSFCSSHRRSVSSWFHSSVSFTRRLRLLFPIFHPPSVFCCGNGSMSRPEVCDQSTRASARSASFLTVLAPRIRCAIYDPVPSKYRSYR